MLVLAALSACLTTPRIPQKTPHYHVLLVGVPDVSAMPSAPLSGVAGDLNTLAAHPDMGAILTYESAGWFIFIKPKAAP